jgi:hypothetical protein
LSLDHGVDSPVLGIFRLATEPLSPLLCQPRRTGLLLAVALFDDVAVSPVGNVSGVGNAPPVGFGGALVVTVTRGSSLVT